MLREKPKHSLDKSCSYKQQAPQPVGAAATLRESPKHSPNTDGYHNLEPVHVSPLRWVSPVFRSRCMATQTHSGEGPLHAANV